MWKRGPQRANELLQELEEENRAVGVDLCIGLANRPGPGLEVAKTPGGVYL